jgi:hypothetical protein
MRVFSLLSERHEFGLASTELHWLLLQGVQRSSTPVHLRVHELATVKLATASVEGNEATARQKANGPTSTVHR